jgi:hypothetical protein
MSITKEEFERQYAEKSGVTIEWLHAHGQFAEPCDCEWDECKGWAMVGRDIPV